MNINKSQQISISFNKFLRISIIIVIIILSIGTFLFFSQNSSISQPTTKAQSSYPQCQQGRITSPCQCGNQIYNAGFCCYHPNANSGIWFDPSYEDIFSNSCPTGNFYFVDQNNPNASDENPGTEEEPWETINKAVQILQSGDVLLVKEGVYKLSSEIIPNSGTLGNFIIFKAYPGEEVIFDGRGRGCFVLQGKSYIVIDGLKMTSSVIGNYSYLILMEHTSNCVIMNSEFYGLKKTTHSNEGCIVALKGNFFSENCIIKNNYFHDCEVPGIRIYKVKNFLIKNNKFVNLSEGIGGKDSVVNLTIKKNIFINMTYQVFYFPGQDFSIDIAVTQNIIDHGGRCIEIGGLGANNPLEGLKIFNNVFYECAPLARIWYVNDYTGLTPIRNFEFYNNIFYRETPSNLNPSGSFPATLINNNKWGGDPITTQDFYFDYNCYYHIDDMWFQNVNKAYYSLQEWQQDTGFENRSFSSNPMFVNSHFHNFHLQPSSPCLNAGIDRQDYDNDGNTTESINMGAYITGNETIGLIDLSQYIVEEPQPNSCASQNGVCCNENQICQNGTFISSSDCGNLCCTGECVSPSVPGDLNQDNKINSSDFQILIQKFKETQNIEIEDLNSDGIVDIKDIGILMHYWNP